MIRINRWHMYGFMVFGYLCGQLNGKHWYSVLMFIAGMLFGAAVFNVVERWHK